MKELTIKTEIFIDDVSSYISGVFVYLGLRVSAWWVNENIVMIKNIIYIAEWERVGR